MEKRLPFDPSDPLSRLNPPPKSPTAKALSIFEDGSIENRNRSNLEHGKMGSVNALVLHQTASPSAENTLKAYSRQPAGAHFLIGRDGKIYQTAGLDQITWHVGRIRPRNKPVLTCSEKEYEKSGPFVKDPGPSHRREQAKDYPDRFPTNDDSIGIELVAAFDSKTQTFEQPTEDQSRSLKRLLKGLKERFGLQENDIFRHGSISYKKVGEGCGLGYD